MHITWNKDTAFSEFKRNYDLRLEDRKYQTLHLADATGHLIYDASGDGNQEWTLSLETDWNLLL